MKKIEVLGTGCPKCGKLAQNAETAARELGLQYELVKVTDISKILEFNVMMTPALAVDGEVVCVGAVPSVDELKTILSS